MLATIGAGKLCGVGGSCSKLQVAENRNKAVSDIDTAHKEIYVDGFIRQILN
jgi:hypothetical protein